MTLRERALELLAEVSGLLEQLLGEVDEAEGDTTDADPIVDLGPPSEELIVGDCQLGGDHDPVDIQGHTYCRKCNKLLATEDA